MNVLIACQAGAGLGLGHLTRSIVVARALREALDTEVHLLSQGDPVSRSDLDEFDHRFIGMDADLDAGILGLAAELEAKVVILDLHPRLLSADIDTLLRGLRRNGHKVVGVDSLVGHADNLDLLFIPSFYFSPSQDLNTTTPVLYGWDCYLLNVKGPAIEWQPGKRVLALAGGSDATGLGETLPVLLDAELPADTELHWVTGPYARQPVWPMAPRISMENHQAPSGLDELMMSTNYAVTVYGVSFFELLYYGIPTVVFSPYGDKDNAELAAVAAEEVALVAADENEAVRKLNELMADAGLADGLSRKARQRLMVPGGQRLARAVAELVA